MSFISTKDGTRIFYKDWGPKNAQPIVFHHGWPLSSDDWDARMLFFAGEGYRVVAHHRGGHGRSTRVSDGHDMDHYADDNQFVPVADSAPISAKLLKEGRLTIYEQFPHGMCTTHADVINADLLAFIKG